MDLNELKKQLYKKDGQMTDRPTAPAEFEPGHESAPEAAPTPQWKNGQGKKYLSVSTKRMIWLVLGVVALAVLVIGGWFLWRAFNSFNANEVALDIFGQERAVSGEEINYVVRYKNNSRVAIGDVRLIFSFPAASTMAEESGAVLRGEEAVITKNLGNLISGQAGQAEFKIRVLGDKDSQQKFKAKLDYRPSNINSNFSNEKEFMSTIISVPLVLSFILPEKIVSGQTMNFSLRYLNTSDAAFTDAKLKIEYPIGFIFDSALPSPSSAGSSSAEGNNVWSLAEIGSREEGNIVIKGTIAGNEGETKVFKAQIGTQKNNEEFLVYSQALASPQVAASPLGVEQILLSAINNNVSTGQDLVYRLKYRNTTDTPIGPVFITVKIDSRVVDLTSVKTANGFFDSSSGIITWNGASLPALESLAARAEGQIEFTLRVRERLPVSNFSDKNFIITTVAKIDSFNVPLALSGTQLSGQSQLIAKVNSDLFLNMKGYYNDRTIPNTGPLPPVVGQKTTYTIYWSLLNTSNDVSGVFVEAYLPSYVSWEGKVFPGEEDIKYDPANGKITWQVGRLSAGVGVLSLVRQVAFQVGFTPSLSQVGSAAIIVQPAKAFGSDNFTGAQISATDKELKSDMPDDPAVGEAKGKIIQ
ncbi:hypothetical protein KJ665_01015 [Patescibacteria group bacterium]|nr:hypothetical protein [Patescibacteria group bacterium]